MELNKNIWYVRLFFWSLGIWEAFRDGNYRYDRERVEVFGTNLCFFVRVVVLYMPFAILLNVVSVALAVASLTLLPIYFFGGVTYGWILGAIALVIGVMWGVKTVRGGIMWVRFVERKRMVRRAREAMKPGEPGFLEVLWAYLVATKKKVCPSIAFHALEEVRQ